METGLNRVGVHGRTGLVAVPIFIVALCLSLQRKCVTMGIITFTRAFSHVHTYLYRTTYDAVVKLHTYRNLQQQRAVLVHK